MLISRSHRTWLAIAAQKHPVLEAAPLTDGTLTPYRAIKRALPAITPDCPTLVIGAGGLGQFGIKVLRLLGASEIIAADIADDKLETACGAGRPPHGEQRQKRCVGEDPADLEGRCGRRV